MTALPFFDLTDADLRVTVGHSLATNRVDPIEELRLREVASYRAIESAPSDRFDRLVRLTARLFDIPFAIITLIDRHQNWHPGRYKLPISNVPDEQSFARACVAGHAVQVVEDASQHPVFCNNPLVQGAPNIRFCAAAPLRNANGWNLGTLEIYDTSPRSFSSRDCSLLHDLGAQVVDALELSKSLLASRASALAITASEELFRSLFENTAVGISVFALGGDFLRVNDRFCEIIGFRREELCRLNFSAVMPEEDRQQDLELLGRLLSGAITHYSIETRHICKDGHAIWVKRTVSLHRDSDGDPLHCIAMTEDIEQRKQAEIARTLLIGELNHRVKNTLSIIKGMAKQILLSASGKDAFAASFEEKLQALSQSHDLLTRSDWQPLHVKALVRELIDGPFSTYGSRIEISGEDVKLNAQTSVMVFLLLHELFTNAIKHGALSDAKGKVEVSAGVEENDDTKELVFNWREHGGPEVSEPESPGFGMFMLEQAAQQGLSGQSQFEFATSGLIYNLRFPIIT